MSLSEQTPASPRGQEVGKLAPVADVKHPGSQEDLVSNWEPAQFGRGCRLWGRDCPLPSGSGCHPPTSLPPVRDGPVCSWLALLWPIQGLAGCKRSSKQEVRFLLTPVPRHQHPRQQTWALSPYPSLLQGGLGFLGCLCPPWLSVLGCVQCVLKECPLWGPGGSLRAGPGLFSPHCTCHRARHPYRRA